MRVPVALICSSSCDIITSFIITIINYSNGGQQYLIVLLICIPLLTDDVKHFSMCLVGFRVSSVVECLFKSFVHFSIVCLTEL